jgi:AcrR family transcriptional regulator
MVKVQKNNSLSNQSKKKLFAALIQLMREKDYRRISISELSEKAGLDRRTFYRHFSSKDDILDLIIVEAFHKHVASMRELPELDAYSINKVYFELLSQYVDFLILLRDQELLSIVQKRISGYIPILNEMFSDGIYCDKHISWSLTYKAGGVWGITERWIKQGAKESPEEMAQLISECGDGCLGELP